MMIFDAETLVDRRVTHTQAPPYLPPSHACRQCVPASASNFCFCVAAVILMQERLFQEKRRVIAMCWIVQRRLVSSLCRPASWVCFVVFFPSRE